MTSRLKDGLWGAVAGAIALAIAGFNFGGWHTTSSAKTLADVAVLTALVPLCSAAVLANPAAVIALKGKKASDYDEVVREYLKDAPWSNLGYTFRRDCGLDIERAQVKSAAVVK